MNNSFRSLCSVKWFTRSKRKAIVENGAENVSLTKNQAWTFASYQYKETLLADMASLSSHLADRSEFSPFRPQDGYLGRRLGEQRGPSHASHRRPLSRYAWRANSGEKTEMFPDRFVYLCRDQLHDSSLSRCTLYPKLTGCLTGIRLYLMAT